MMTRVKHITPIDKLNLMLKSTLCDYSDPYLLISGITTITGAGRKEWKWKKQKSNIKKLCTVY